MKSFPGFGDPYFSFSWESSPAWGGGGGQKPQFGPSQVPRENLGIGLEGTCGRRSGTEVPGLVN